MDGARLLPSKQFCWALAPFKRYNTGVGSGKISRPSIMASFFTRQWLWLLPLTAFACGDDSPQPTQPPAAKVNAIDPAPAPLRRLLARQYIGSIDYLLGSEAALAASPPDDEQLNGLASIAAAQYTHTALSTNRLEQSAHAVATAAMGNAERVAELLGCSPKRYDDSACAGSFVQRFGRLAFRRPLSKQEQASYLQVALGGAASGRDFYSGIQLVIAAMLQSPHFLYQVELGTDEETADSNASYPRKRLNGYEVATRMSFLLHDRTPSSELLDAAEAGDLDTAAGVRAWAQSMVAQPAAQAASEAFFREYLRLDNIDDHHKDSAIYPNYSIALGQSMKGETLQLIRHVLWEKEAPFYDLLTVPYTFVDKRMATFYGVEAPPEGKDWAKRTPPSEQRRQGLLAQPSVLTSQSNPTRTSPTHRGMFVMETLLCRSMPPPPDDVVTELPPTSKAATMRERLKVHLEDEVCSSCHFQSDNIGLALENFDGMGSYRTKENGSLIDTNVELSTLGAFDGPASLGELLAQEPEVSFCALRHLHRHATGHVELNREFGGLREIEQAWKAKNYSFPALLVELVSSELFRSIGVAEDTNDGKGTEAP